MKRSVRLLSLTVTILVLILAISSCSGAPEPTVTRGDFDFSVTYQIGDEVTTISGVYVCEFVKGGRAIDGYYREWNGYIKDSDLENDVVLATKDGDTLYLDLDLDPEYFMSDPFYSVVDKGAPTPELYVSSTTDGEPSFKDASEFDARIVSYSYDQPIENVYK